MAQREHYTISDLRLVHACPVRYYYERDDPIRESDRYAICKQVSYHLGKPLDPDLIWNGVLAVRPGIDISLRGLLEMSLAACNKSSWKPAVQYDAHVRSDKLKIVGMIDRIDADGAFSIVRPSGAMPFGIPSADRLQVAAISFCLEEMTGKVVAGGYLEYIPDGVSRFHEVQPRDRRQVITTLQKIRSIHEGEIPKHPLNAPCNRCKYRKKCESSGGHRLSELL